MHFAVAVIIPPQELSDPTRFVCQQMERYDSHLEVEPYVCYSRERAADDLPRHRESIRQVIEQAGPHTDVDELRVRLTQLERMTGEDYYAGFIARWHSFNEQGEPISTFNPDAIWDWYVIGGRWNGWINGLVLDGDAFTDKLANNTAPIEQVIASRRIPFVIVTPDGEWHEQVVTDDSSQADAAWTEQALAIFARYLGHHIVLVDVHS